MTDTEPSQAIHFKYLTQLGIPVKGFTVISRCDSVVMITCSEDQCVLRLICSGKFRTINIIFNTCFQTTWIVGPHADRTEQRPFRVSRHYLSSQLCTVEAQQIGRGNHYTIPSHFTASLWFKMTQTSKHGTHRAKPRKRQGYGYIRLLHSSLSGRKRVAILQNCTLEPQHLGW